MNQLRLKEQERQNKLMQPLSRQMVTKSVNSYTNHSETFNSGDEVDHYLRYEKALERQRKAQTDQNSRCMSNYTTSPPMGNRNKYSHVKSKVNTKRPNKNRNQTLAYSLLDRSIDNTINMIESARRKNNDSMDRCKYSL